MRNIPTTTLRLLQDRFHTVIRERIANTDVDEKLPLPELKPPFPTIDNPNWFAVSGMYGGFNYWFEGDGTNAKLISESWCRVVEGSGQRHEITESEHKLVDEGFV
ncbi:MAG: hypothetical protein WD049_00020 [Candidatus Paceibacterota bacterium]